MREMWEKMSRGPSSPGFNLICIWIDTYKMCCFWSPVFQLLHSSCSRRNTGQNLIERRIALLSNILISGLW